VRQRQGALVTWGRIYETFEFTTTTPALQ
jgi:hypothetical protein